MAISNPNFQCEHVGQLCLYNIGFPRPHWIAEGQLFCSLGDVVIRLILHLLNGMILQVGGHVWWYVDTDQTRAKTHFPNQCQQLLQHARQDGMECHISRCLEHSKVGTAPRNLSCTLLQTLQNTIALYMYDFLVNRFWATANVDYVLVMCHHVSFFCQLVSVFICNYHFMYAGIHGMYYDNIGIYMIMCPYKHYIVPWNICWSVGQPRRFRAVPQTRGSKKKEQSQGTKVEKQWENYDLWHFRTVFPQHWKKKRDNPNDKRTTTRFRTTSKKSPTVQTPMQMQCNTITSILLIFPVASS